MQCPLFNGHVGMLFLICFLPHRRWRWFAGATVGIIAKRYVVNPPHHSRSPSLPPSFYHTGAARAAWLICSDNCEDNWWSGMQEILIGMVWYARDMRPAVTTNDMLVADHGPHAFSDCRCFSNSPRFLGDPLKDVVPGPWFHRHFFFKIFPSCWLGWDMLKI